MKKFKAEFRFHNPEATRPGPDTRWVDFEATSRSAAERQAKAHAKSNEWRYCQLVETP